MKTLMVICTGILFAFAVFLPGVAAQDTGPRVINGGVLNGKATSLPKPEYPSIAREAGIGGVVSVNVVIDESGIVVSAVADANDQRIRKSKDGTVLEPVAVDPSLREAAENAARLARFPPTFLSGQPVKIKGTIVYNFVSGKDVTTETPKAFGGDVLNGKALSLAKAEYPAAAKAVGAEGAVSVQITIDEEGNVISAAAVSGHPLLRAAAVNAAQQAKFSPTLLSGQPVKVSGVLTYNFSLPKKDDQ